MVIKQIDAVEMLRSLQDQSVNLHLDDPPFGVNYLNKKDYDDRPGVVEWELLEQEAYRTLHEKGNWVFFTGWSRVSNVLLRILKSSSALSFLEIGKLMEKEDMKDIFKKHSRWTWKNQIAWNRIKGQGGAGM